MGFSRFGMSEKESKQGMYVCMYACMYVWKSVNDVIKDIMKIGHVIL